MFLAKAQKNSRYIAGPLVLLWLLCQSMLLCAGLLSYSSTMPSTHLDSQVISNTSMMTKHSHDMSHLSSDMSIHAHETVNGVMDENCCDDQENVLSNTFFGSLAFLLFLPLYWLVVSLKTIVKHFANHKEPPPRYNYPRNHVFNCTFLN